MRAVTVGGSYVALASAANGMVRAGKPRVLLPAVSRSKLQKRRPQQCVQSRRLRVWALGRSHINAAGDCSSSETSVYNISISHREAGNMPRAVECARDALSVWQAGSAAAVSSSYHGCSHKGLPSREHNSRAMAMLKLARMRVGFTFFAFRLLHARGL